VLVVVVVLVVPLLVVLLPLAVEEQEVMELQIQAEALVAISQAKETVKQAVVQELWFLDIRLLLQLLLELGLLAQLLQWVQIRLPPLRLVLET